MRLLLIDNAGLMADFALRCQDAGHEVRWYIRQSRMTDGIGKGLLVGKSKLVDDYQPWARWADLIVLADNVRYLHDMERWREEGILVAGASVESAAWEIDRTKGQQVLKSVGIKVPDYKTFDDYDRAIAYVKREGRAFVSKPCGDEEDKSLSYVAKSPADMVYMLERWKKNHRHKDAFILQECVKGVEMAVGGWFGPNGFIPGWHENWEFKKLMAGDTGPATGEMGTIVRVVAQSKLADLVLKPVAKKLAALEYVGYVDVNCIVDDKGTPWPLEFTMRPGWPTFNIQMAMLKDGEDPANWLYDLAAGNATDPFRKDEVACGVVMAIPDFPFSRFTRKDVHGIPIYNLDNKNRYRRNLHPCEVMRGEAPTDVNGKVVTLPCMTTAGDYLLVGSGLGESVRSARIKAYRALESLEVPNSPFWRPDIGQRLKKQLPTIQSLGFAKGLLF
jgi:phosphoribosylamine--glycine ligase